MKNILCALVGLIAFVTIGEVSHVVTVIPQAEVGGPICAESILIGDVAISEREQVSSEKLGVFRGLVTDDSSNGELAGWPGCYSCGSLKPCMVERDILFAFALNERRPHHNIIGGRLTKVLNFDRNAIEWPARVKSMTINIHHVKVGPQLALGSFPGRSDGCLRRLGGFAGFIKHPLGVLGGNPSFFQSALYEPNTNAGNGGGHGGNDNHEQRPQGHILLGFQILYLVLSGCLLIGGSLLCYKIADRGYDFTKRWGEWFGLGSVLLTFSLGPLLIGAFLFFGYWLTFGAGRFLLLG